MEDEREELFREEEQRDWQEKWFDTPGDVDDFIFYGYEDEAAFPAQRADRFGPPLFYRLLSILFSPTKYLRKILTSIIINEAVPPAPPRP